MSRRPSNANTPELISRIARCASVASLCSTISVTAPVAASRTIRPYPVESGTSALSTVTALPSAVWVAASAARVSPHSSGVSPQTTITVPSTVPPSSSSPTRTAFPVPFCSAW